MPLTVRDVVALTKPRLSGLVIVTCGAGMLLAPGRIDALRAVVALFATSMVVGAANALNSYLERDLDRYMERTRERPLPAGRLDPRVALVVSCALAAVSMPLLTLAVNAMTGLLALVALVTYVLVYTPMKQRSALAMWVGAVPGAIPPLMGWTAVRNQIEAPGLALFAILFFWQLPHFIAIAIYRREDYARAGHKVLPLVVGDRAVKAHAAVWTAVLVAASLAPTLLAATGPVYLATAGVLGAVFLGWAFAGFWQPALSRPWARSLFFTSLVYLPTLLTVLVLDAR